MDWDSRYINADTPWDKGAASPVLTWLTTKLPYLFETGSKALVVGCGRGHDVAPLLDAGMEPCGMDLSATALTEAAKQFSDSPNASWLKADLFDMDASQKGVYDMVWEHTCYCAISPEMRADYVDAVCELLKPNAYLVGVFFIDTGIPIAEGPPFSTSREEVFENFKRKFHLVWEGKPEASYDGREGREWVMVWRKPITGV